MVAQCSQEFWWSIANTMEVVADEILDHFYYGPLISLPIFALLMLKRADLRAASLFALSLPGAIGGIAVLLSTAMSDTLIRSELAMALYFPALWIMPLVAIAQVRRLSQPTRALTLRGVIWLSFAAALIIGLYFLTAYANGLEL